MRAVAAEVGVTPMALYYHIEGKEELFRLVVAEVSSQWLPLQLGDQGWEYSLRQHLISQWEVLTRYPGLGSYLIAQPTLGVTSTALNNGVRFFEEAGFDPSQAPLAWSFAMTYLHGRLSVDARLWHLAEAPRVEGLHAHDYVNFGVEAVIQGLSSMTLSHSPPSEV